ncbi:hypothetical protein HQ576_09810 [bacterium]|nr:hypothetical protein [bacterium]
MKDETLLKLRSWLFALLALVALVAAGQLLPIADRMRADLVPHEEGSFGTLPPAIVLANRAGGIFRALAINTLWMRATELQEKGEVFELVQLYKLITALEPRFPMVWAYRAWNAAYNVSVKFPAIMGRIFDLSDPRNQPDQRWVWVQNGIRTLRDEGIPYNPNAERLYRELAWIYSHKIGQDMDDAHLYYKVMLAVDMEKVLGKPPYRTTIERIYNAPKTREKLLADATVRALVDALVQAGVDVFGRPVDVVSRSDALPEAARTALADPAGAAAAGALDAFLRARYANDTLKLRPAVMWEMMERYGPVDWRLPEAHALYWTHRGAETMADEDARDGNTARIAFHALAEFYRRGRLTFHYERDKPERTLWRTSTHFGFMKRAVAFHEAIIKEYKGKYQDNPLREGYMNFLREIVLDLYLHTDIKRSREYYKKLQVFGPESKVAYEDFISGRFLDRMKNATIEQNKNLIQSILLEAVRWASYGDMQQATGREQLAKLIRKRYNDKGYRFQMPPVRELYPEAFMWALRRFADWQIERLDELYPKQMKEGRKRLDELRRQAEKPAPAPSPS